MQAKSISLRSDKTDAYKSLHCLWICVDDVLAAYEWQWRSPKSLGIVTGTINSSATFNAAVTSIVCSGDVYSNPGPIARTKIDNDHGKANCRIPVYVRITNQVSIKATPIQIIELIKDREHH